MWPAPSRRAVPAGTAPGDRRGGEREGRARRWENTLSWIARSVARQVSGLYSRFGPLRHRNSADRRLALAISNRLGWLAIARPGKIRKHLFSLLPCRGTVQAAIVTIVLKFCGVSHARDCRFVVGRVL